VAAAGISDREPPSVGQLVVAGHPERWRRERRRQHARREQRWRRRAVQEQLLASRALKKHRRRKEPVSRPRGGCVLLLLLLPPLLLGVDLREVAEAEPRHLPGDVLEEQLVLLAEAPLLRLRRRLRSHSPLPFLDKKPPRNFEHGGDKKAPPLSADGNWKRGIWRYEAGWGGIAFLNLRRNFFYSPGLLASLEKKEGESREKAAVGFCASGSVGFCSFSFFIWTEWSLFVQFVVAFAQGV
jgi:hypothetical protein